MSTQGEPKRILIRAPNWLGDHVMALPFYQGLRSRYPSSMIAILCPESHSPVFPHLFDETILLPTNRRTLRTFRELIQRISSTRFDLGISLPSSISSAALLYGARIPHRVGFAETGAKLFYTALLNWSGRSSGKHKTDLYLELLELLTTPGHPLQMSQAVSSHTRREKSIVVAPGASIPLREWPYYQDLISRLLEEFPDFKVIVVGTHTESKWHGFLRRMDHPRVEDRVEKTTVAELIQLCRTAQLVITNDSGVAHIAGTLADTPTLVLFGPGDPSYIRPLGRHVSILRNTDIPCHPCEKPYCSEKFGYQTCLRSLSVDSVFNDTCEILKAEYNKQMFAQLHSLDH